MNFALKNDFIMKKFKDLIFQYLLIEFRNYLITF